MNKILFSVAAALCTFTLSYAQPVVDIADVEYAAKDFNYNRGLQLKNAGNYQEAQAAFQKSIELNPNEPRPYFTLATMQGYEQGIVNYTKAIALAEKSNPSLCAQILDWRSFAYLAVGKKDEALADAQRAYDICLNLPTDDPSKTQGCIALYNYYGNEKNFQLVAKYTREAIKYAPAMPDYYSQLARALLNIGTPEALTEARQAVADALTLSSGNADNIRNLQAQIAMADNNLGLAAQILVNLVGQYGLGNRTPSELRSAWYDLLAKDPTPAILQIKGNMASSPMVAQWPSLLADVYASEAVNNRLLAAQYRRKAYDISGNRYYLIGESFDRYAAGDLNGALRVVDEFVAIDSTYAPAFELRASVNSLLDRKQTVIADFSKAVELSGGSASTLYQRAWFERYNNMLQEAALDMTSAIQKNDDNAHYYLTRGNIFAQLGENDMARDDYQMAHDVARRHLQEADDADSAYISEERQQLAFALLELGNADAALQEMDNAQQTTALQKKGALYNKACLLSLMNRKADAISTLREAINEGYDQYVHLGRDRDLDNIRSLKEFDALVAQAKANADQKNGVAPAAKAKTATNAEPTIVEVPFSKNRGGTLTVPCTVNGLPLNFIFDSGAHDVSISRTEANFMLRNGYLKTEDLGSRSYSTVADGGLVAGTSIILRSITFGGVTLKNVKASIVENQAAPLLLGQTAMSRYGTATIDYDKGVIRLVSSANQ